MALLRPRPALGAAALVLLTALTPIDASLAAPERAAAAPATSATSAAGRLVVVDRNVEKKDRVVAATVAHARSVGADAIMLQEVCKSAVDEIKGDHPGWSVAWKRDHGECKGGRAKGNAVVWTAGGKGVAVVEKKFGHQTRLPNRDIRSKSNVICLVVPGGPNVCSTHLISGFPRTGRAQARELSALTAPWIRRGRTVVVAGDFNARPDAATVGALYANRGSGRFYDSIRRDGRPCRCGPPTHFGRRSGNVGKIDYVFVSTNAWRKGRAATTSVERGPRTGSTSSDHARITARLDVRR